MEIIKINKGEKCHLLTALESTSGRRVFCKCECGKEKSISKYHFKGRTQKSCGCLNLKHGHTINKKRSPEFLSWSTMIQRCYYEKTEGFEYYGGRGVTVCDRWLGNKGFENFLEDMGKRPKGMTLDRTEDAIIYSKETCKWSSKNEQATFKRAYGKLKLNGVSETKQGKFRAMIGYEGKKYNIGLFKTAHLASLAYQACRFALYGRYC